MVTFETQIDAGCGAVRQALARVMAGPGDLAVACRHPLGPPNLRDSLSQTALFLYRIVGPIAHIRVMTETGYAEISADEPTFLADDVVDVNAPTPMGRCDEHYLEECVAHCQDCGTAVCARCVVTVGRVGTFCRSCALVRAGVRTRRAANHSMS